MGWPPPPLLLSRKDPYSCAQDTSPCVFVCGGVSGYLLAESLPASVYGACCGPRRGPLCSHQNTLFFIKLQPHPLFLLMSSFFSFCLMTVITRSVSETVTEISPETKKDLKACFIRFKFFDSHIWWQIASQIWQHSSKA